ncbi:hypothetical protein TIFTF001_052500 [Ficus carica]|uniref:MULE transposase domain-containing protein n=1 Tax=Ficus carica TaxID=3494 RepID=A0AA88EHE5_FICCA|nr:hypothetical protein TIFTF001_052497 [Ficus carica]GMN74984.1 hypothetical protein TIFTF001_052498 [Ficus carica]GMN74987.1 hypothetical protein TIFTF001_052499 [Ficus carica]GMN74990.1 hypothetical protein TIFTF001_052500 [Ficus carica]
MKGILVPETATYIGLIELVRSAIGIRGPAKTIVMRYGVEPEMPLVRIQCDADVKFYLQLKKNDVHVLSKFPITIDVLDESATEAKPPEVRESNHIDVQRSREGGQSDEAMQHVDDSNMIILPPPPHIPSPTIGLDLHTESGIEKLHQGEFGVSFNYLRAWRGKEAALISLRGDDAESYNVLLAWAEMVKRKNHASDIHIEIDSGNCLQYFYMCLAASKHGWPYYRPVIVVNGSVLNAKFGGMLLAACGHDANSSIFPLAFGIVPSESNESWKWFFEKLRDSIGTRESLSFVADRHKGIEYAANLVYPDAVFSICVQHLAANLKTSEHHRHMESIRSPNPDMHQYLVQADPTKWSRAYFNGRRYTIMKTNITESLNSVDRKARLMLVGFLVEWLRELLQRWFVERREEALKITSKLAPKADKLIRTNFSLGLTVTLRPTDQFEYAVTNNAD